MSAQEKEEPRELRAHTDELVQRLYGELRELASNMLLAERPGHTLQATAVVHEAFLALTRQDRTEWTGREHFRAVACTVIRRLLIDHARGVRSDKRGGGWSRITLGDGPLREDVEPERLIALDAALDDLRRLSERQARVVELRWFGGLSVDETARELGVAPRTVDGDWRLARAWLRRALEERG